MHRPSPSTLAMAAVPVIAIVALVVAESFHRNAKAEVVASAISGAPDVPDPPKKSARSSSSRSSSSSRASAVAQPSRRVRVVTPVPEAPPEPSPTDVTAVDMPPSALPQPTWVTPGGANARSWIRRQDRLNQPKSTPDAIVEEGMTE